VRVTVDLYEAERCQPKQGWFERLLVARVNSEAVGFLASTTGAKLWLVVVDESVRGRGGAGVLVEAARTYFNPTKVTHGYPVSADGAAMNEKYKILPHPDEADRPEVWPPDVATEKSNAFLARVRGVPAGIPFPSQPTRSAIHEEVLG
jgi:GNAT superfamily N-acetyltransferase